MIELLIDHLHLLMLIAVCIGLMAGYPVALTLAGTALIFAGIGIGLCLVEPQRLQGFPIRVEQLMNNSQLFAVPLFVLMGVILERSRVAEDLIETLGQALRHVRGGIGFALVIVGAMLAASTGIVGATVVTMTLIALPAMLRQGYSPRLSTGVIAASGTLGQIIPPSIVLILLADAISNANQAAAFGTGELAAAAVSVGDLFAGAILPGMILVGLYLAYVAANALFNPKACPKPSDRMAPDDPLAAPIPVGRAVFAIAGPIALIVSVLGSILAGLATPTEAASVGVLGALLLAGARLSLEVERAPGRSVFGRTLISILLAAASLLVLFFLGASGTARALVEAGGVAPWLTLGPPIFLLLSGIVLAALRMARFGHLNPALRNCAEVSAMVFLILIGAQLFSIVFRELGGDVYVACILDQIPGGLAGALIAVMLIMFVLGFFLDFIEITYVVVPIVAPALILMGADPIWLGVLMAINLQTSFLTPPFGFALFYLRGAAPPGVETLDIWKGAVPFILLQLLGLGLVVAFPELATWLPAVAAD